MRYCLLLLLVFTMSHRGNAQEIETIDKFTTGYINGTYMNKYKTIDGVLYAVGYEGTKDWILVRYPAGSRNTVYHVHPNCRVEEVARYNLSGHPCKPYDKGVQIVVYSDYTTKTIIIE